MSLVLVTGSGVAALDLPGIARQTAARDAAIDTYSLPVGAFTDGVVPSVAIEGAVKREAWVINSPGLTPVQVMRPLRDQLIADGFEIVLDCANAVCGGFDFRFALEVLPAPNMYVNISSYQFVSAVRGAKSAPNSGVSLLVSTTRDSAYVQIVSAGSDVPKAEVGTGEIKADKTDAAPSVPVAGLAGLMERGFAVLDGVEFQSGSTRLGEGPFEAIKELAAILTDNPGLNIALVGHTDSTGALDANISVSRSRARAVRERLIESYGIDAARIDAQGMGYLAPRASNLTAEGREANRRVEAILLSAE